MGKDVYRGKVAYTWISQDTLQGVVVMDPFSHAFSKTQMIAEQDTSFFQRQYLFPPKCSKQFVWVHSKEKLQGICQAQNWPLPIYRQKENSLGNGLTTNQVHASLGHKFSPTSSLSSQQQSNTDNNLDEGRIHWAKKADG